MARKICKCVVMQQLMLLLGAEKAAEMHLRPAGNWSNADWLTHFEEEERFVLPLVPRSIADDIFLDHEKFRAQIKVKGKIVNLDMLEAHAEFEDEVVLYYLGHLLDEHRGAVAAGVGRPNAIARRAASRSAGRSRSSVRGTSAVTMPGEASSSETFLVLLALGAGLILASALA